MTAVNLIVQERGVYIIADGALYDHDGTVRAICSKALIADGERLALIPGGRANPVEVRDGLIRSGANTQAEIMQALPRIAADIRAGNRRAHPEWDAAGDNDLQLYVALWSDERDQPEAWMLSTCALPHWGPYVPGTWIQVDSMLNLVEPIADVLGRDADVSRAAEFDPSTDGLAVLEAQRRYVWPDGRHYVGGRVELVSVTREGVSKKVLREWPDKIGERIAA